MKKQFLKVLILPALVIVAIFIYVAGVLLLNSVRDYGPKNQLFIPEEKNTQTKLLSDSIFTMLSWNIGYGGLGKDADFFYDGGEMAIPPYNEYNEYFQGIGKVLGSLDSIAIVLLQEVDTFSVRSYYENQYLEISKIFHSYNSYYVKNYDVQFVPLPLLRPMGRVVSGLATFMRFSSSSYEQIVFQGNFAWPKGLFMPDRCFLTTRIPLDSGYDLVIINTHNSAFDDGQLRYGQMVLLEEYMTGLYAEGNYVVAGGDWNINPPHYQGTPFVSGDVVSKVPFEFNWKEPSWSVIFDSDYPTNRSVSGPYIPGNTPTTVIDFFVCSPNVNPIEVRVLYDGFLYSDHQPVYFKFELK